MDAPVSRPDFRFVCDDRPLGKNQHLRAIAICDGIADYLQGPGGVGSMSERVTGVRKGTR